MTTHLNGFEILGLIEAKWLQKGGQRGLLGEPISNAEPVFNGVDRGGLVQRFAGGIIAWHPLIDGGAHEVHGLILAHWHALGGPTFGFPITDEEVPVADPGGRYNHFRAPGQLDRSIYWHPDVGAAHEVIGWIRDKWASLGWEKSELGYPVAPEVVGVDDGRVQHFQRGSIAWHNSIGDGQRGGAHEVHGAIGVRWRALGDTAFGYPITDEEVPAGDQAGRYNHFRASGQLDRSIYWHRDIGAAHEVIGWIRDKWISLGWEKSVLGYPSGPEMVALGGVVQAFRYGFMAWHPSIGDGCRGGAHEVHGAIAIRWDSVGRANYGFPTTDEQVTPDRGGRYNHFRAVHLPGTPDNRSIYWHPSVEDGAHPVMGLIRDKWASLGWEKSEVGYPVSGERPRRGTGQIQDFQRGAIAWVLGGDAWVDWFRSQ